MNEEELRLECLRLALAMFSTDAVMPTTAEDMTGAALKFYDFICGETKEAA